VSDFNSGHDLRVLGWRTVWDSPLCGKSASSSPAGSAPLPTHALSQLKKSLTNSTTCECDHGIAGRPENGQETKAGEIRELKSDE